MTDEVELRGDVPVDMHPDCLLREAKVLDADGTVGRMALASGREALGAIYRTYAAMQDAERALQSAAPEDLRRQTPDGRSQFLGDLRMHGGQVRRFHGHEHEYAAAAEEAFNRASKTADARMGELQKYRARLEGEVAEALADPSRLAVEVRAHVKALPDGERFGFAVAAVERGDLPTVAALLQAQPFLSGLAAEQHDILRERAAAKFAPVSSSQLKAVDAVMERVRTAGTSLVKRYADALKFKDSPRATANRKVAQLRAV